MKLARWLASVGMILVTAVPALATHGGIHPTFRSESVYFHCTGPTKLHTVNWQLGSGSVPWNTTAPTQSYLSGAGCGAPDTFLYDTASDNPYDVTFRGTFTGNLRHLTVRLHNLILGRARTVESTTMAVRLRIDGEDYLPLGIGYGTQVDVIPVPSATGATELLEFSIKDIGTVTEIEDGQGNVIDVLTTGVAKEDGDGTSEHEVVLQFNPFYTPLSNAFVWDATEIASGMTFNPPTLAAANVTATPPS